jgi:hypothetical protein
MIGTVRNVSTDHARPRRLETIPSYPALLLERLENDRHGRRHDRPREHLVKVRVRDPKALAQRRVATLEPGVRTGDECSEEVRRDEREGHVRGEDQHVGHRPEIEPAPGIVEARITTPHGVHEERETSGNQEGAEEREHGQPRELLLRLQHTPGRLRDLPRALEHESSIDDPGRPWKAGS